VGQNGGNTHANILVGKHFNHWTALNTALLTPQGQAGERWRRLSRPKLASPTGYELPDRDGNRFYPSPWTAPLSGHSCASEAAGLAGGLNLPSSGGFPVPNILAKIWQSSAGMPEIAGGLQEIAALGRNLESPW